MPLITDTQIKEMYGSREIALLTQFQYWNAGACWVKTTTATLTDGRYRMYYLQVHI